MPDDDNNSPNETDQLPDRRRVTLDFRGLETSLAPLIPLASRALDIADRRADNDAKTLDLGSQLQLAEQQAAKEERKDLLAHDRWMTSVTLGFLGGLLLMALALVLWSAHPDLGRDIMGAVVSGALGFIAGRGFEAQKQRNARHQPKVDE
ncbi:hypothetical protein L6R53_14120 [Myxococcota bacterium]|nr:hypothetical protein [Myxococcota bacterium]